MEDKNNIIVGDREYKVKEARTQEELEKGLSDLTELPEGEGMLFYMPGEQSQYVFTMKDMKIPIDIVFINLDLEVVDVRKDCLPGKKRVVSSTENMSLDDYIAFVLEVNPNSGILIGDSLELEEDAPVMKVLAPDGSTLMELWGGERIVSRRETKVLIRKAKKADISKDDKDYRTLGRYIFKVLRAQDNREPEYVETAK